MIPILRESQAGTLRTPYLRNNDPRLRHTPKGGVTKANSPAVSIQVSLADVVAELEELQELEDDWNGEDAPSIDRSTVALARTVIRDVAEAAEQAGGYVWQRPEVAPTSDGGVSLTWRVYGKLVWLRFSPGTLDVTCITRTEDTKPERIVLSPGFATEAVLRTLIP